MRPRRTAWSCFSIPSRPGGWLGVLDGNGLAKARRYGEFLGARFKDTPNIIWMSGNDFQGWRDKSQSALVRAVMRGLADKDLNHIQTVELDYYVSASLDDRALRPLVGLDAVYTYRPTYAKTLSEYKRADFRPTFMVEANTSSSRTAAPTAAAPRTCAARNGDRALRHHRPALRQRVVVAAAGRLADNLDTVGIRQLPM